ncbi:MAG: hypothetical protein IJT81_05090 [Lachnospiraceae bacterium]|nr:hypothetical protein [Lachnospiraceae bacterium]MBQ9580364.1 hypothetical protein [Lachnospiraceae bacterium]
MCLRFFKKRKEKKKLKEVTDRYEADILSSERLKDIDFVKRYVVEQCEQMTKSATELSDLKKEYATLTSYLTDIQLIETMDEEDHNKLLDIANNIVNLNKAKKDMMETLGKIPDSRYNAIGSYEDDIPKAIERLRENERTQAVMKKDMEYLDGEKIEWAYEKSAINDEQNTLKKFSFLLILLIGSAAIVYFCLMNLYGGEKVHLALIIALISGVAECGILWRMQNNKRDILQCNVNYNKAVEIQNSVKLKYVNITNAVDYAHDKYNTKSADDLAADWQKYLEAKKDRERLIEANEDLEYYRNAMVELLRSYNLYDALTWPYQVDALLDPKEMVEVKHAHLEKRQNVRLRMGELIDTVRDTKDVVEKLTTEQNVLNAEVRGIIETVNRITGDIA